MCIFRHLEASVAGADWHNMKLGVKARSHHTQGLIGYVKDI